ncbi:hypothetical protein [Bacteroides cellulosilyticus]|uniref:hypothetical protein n=1 Tax=Bacteroides cellulosilyticus TaxID=246787 RepID=UPI00356A4E8D
MKTSDKPTAHILVRASTNSEWDCCDFAIVHLSEEWRRLQEKRIEAVKPFGDDYSFQSMRFYDGSVEFFQSGDEEPSIEELLADKQWVFVELGNGELDELTSPENRLDFYKIVIYREGNARYEAFGKHTNEEFWTNEFPLQQLTGQTIKI